MRRFCIHPNKQGDFMNLLVQVWFRGSTDENAGQIRRWALLHGMAALSEVQIILYEERFAANAQQTRHSHFCP
jgi:hypothetical protein